MGSNNGDVKDFLPIHAVLAEIAKCLAERDELVLEAPPGAGKTTVVPLALLDAPWLAGTKILMLEPRRMAARGAAVRMAALLGEQVGQTVGYRVRFDTRVSALTRIEVVTEGVLGRMLLDNPALSGVGLLIFDEFHERSLEADLGLALALQGRELFREAQPPLKILAMSATLDGEGLATLLDQAPLIRSSGRTFPVELHYGRTARSGASIVDPIVDVLLELASEGGPRRGCVLVFLPGRAEIAAVHKVLARRLEALPVDLQGQVEVVALHGGLKLEQQQRAIQPPPAGRRRILLSTNIAETSLTIEGVDTVVDSGLERVPRFDPRVGMSRLHTQRISRASSVQRMGRAGRMRPGRCYRLWSEEQQGQLREHGVPEILQADLMPMAIRLLAWGVDDPAELSWLDPPPLAPWTQSLQLLAHLGAVAPSGGESWCLTAHGEAMARLPLHPRLAHMLLRASAVGLGEAACNLAALLTEGIPRGGKDVDLSGLLVLFDPGASCPAGLVNWLQRVRRLARQYRRLCPAANRRATPPAGGPDRAGLLLAWAYPDRIARSRQPGGAIYQLANGRAAQLLKGDPLCTTPWLAVAEVGGEAGRAHDRIYSAAPLEPGLFDDVLSDLLEETEVAEWDDKSGRFVAEKRISVGALLVSRSALSQVDVELRQVALLQMVSRKGLQILPWTDALRQWQARVCLLRVLFDGAPEDNPWPDVSDGALLANAASWLGPALAQVERLDDIKGLELSALLYPMLPWTKARQLDEWAPPIWQLPTGSRAPIDYLQDPPVLRVRLQEMFGCARAPAIAGGRVILMLHLLSPAGRPLQVTRDLESFWRGSYKSVRKEMKGRYPKHPWPQDPLAAEPTRYAKRRRDR